MWRASSDPDTQARLVRMTLGNDLINKDRNIKITDTDISSGSRVAHSTVNWITKTLNYFNIFILKYIN